MSRKSLIWLGAMIGSVIGGYIPVLWGSSLFSYSSILGNILGGLVGIWAGLKIVNEIGV